jgi:Transglycosylase SLT domain
MKIGLRLLGLFAAFTAFSASAVIPPAYHKIANDYQIPVDVFYAVMLQESGKSIVVHTHKQKTLPWPWVLNVELKPYFFDSRDSAVIALKQFLAINHNARIAVGLGQIYLPSHGHLFVDKTLLLDPGVNLNYAAKILASEFQWTLDQATPNWWIAVGRYHTPSNKILAKEYREGVYRRCQKISDLCSRYGAI